MSDINANINNAECMLTKNHMGYDTIMNICSGKVTNVDWTGLDWFLSLIVLGFLALLLAITVGGFVFIGKEIFDS